MSAPRSIVIANAGSGKTFTLANRIIAWCIEEIRAGREPNPSRILAVTFTRKAAGEILARILANAAEGAADDDSGAKARAKFEVVVGAATAAEYQGVLVALCSELHRMQVGTIDGFFHRIASALPDEVGLPPEWTVGDDQEIDELRAQVAAEILADEHAGELIDLLEDGAPKPSVMRSISDLLGGSTISVLDIYRATAAAGDAGIQSAWGWIERLRSASEPKKAEFDELVEVFARLEADIPRGDRGRGAPNKNWVNQHAKLLALMRVRDFRNIAAVGFLASLHAAAQSEAGGSYGKAPVPDSFRDFARRFVPHLRAALLGDIAKRMSGALRVLPMADRALRTKQEETGIYSFSDIGRGVSLAAQRKGSRVASADALREALGADIRDLAIDEAQDTSVEQFLAMQPMLADVLGVRDPADAGRFLLVGDPKQSIYGWRGGTPGLIAQIRQDYAAQLGDGSALTRSFRSSPIVMDLVNRVFGSLERDLIPLVAAKHLEDRTALCDLLKREGVPLTATESAFKRAIAQWEFAPHEADKKTLPGRIEAYAFGKKKAEPRKKGKKGAPAPTEPGAETVLEPQVEVVEEEELESTECAAHVAARIHRDFPQRSIGILVRTNKEISDIIAKLKSLGVPASDEGRSTLLDSPAVAGVVALLRLIDDPSDRVSHFLVSRGPLQKFTGLAELESCSVDDSHKAARDLATRLRGRLADVGLAALLREVCAALVSAGIGSRDRARLERVIAIAEDFADLPHARTIDFLEAIAADKADSSSSDKVRVMTVHKSKGLEFDEVVLASLDGGWGSAPKGWGMLATEPTRPPALVAPLASEKIRNWIPELVVLERDGRRRQLLDDLSSLYVAMTRARYGLHLLMDNNEPGELPTASKLIRAAVSAAAAGSTDTLASAPSIGTAFGAAKPDASAPFWSATFGEQAAASTTQAIATNDAPSSAGDPPPPAPLVEIVARHGGSAKSPSSHDAASLWHIGPFTNEDIAVRGVLVHECFREIESTSDYDTDDKREALVARAARRAAVEKGTPIAPKTVEDVRQLFARIALGPIADALRPTAGVRVRAELPFVRATAEGLVHGRIDRLELLERDGRVVGAVIVDFKTGATGASQADLARKIADYTDQLRGYQRAVAEMYDLDPAAIQLRLLFVDRGEVVGA